MTHLDNLIELALSEDLNEKGDITSMALYDEAQKGSFEINVRSNGVISGIKVAQQVFNEVDENIEVAWRKVDGEFCGAGETIAFVEGSLTSILKAERTVLNFLCHLSGIATTTRNYVHVLEEINSSTKIRDTRKTTPGFRIIEKEAVVHGGGVNHRMGLYDGFLVKDNHVDGVSIGEVVEKCRDFDSEVILEVEVDTVEQLVIVAGTKPDLILLDNFTPEMVHEAQALELGIPFEISGGVNLTNVKEYGATNVKYIAIGALTHSASILDIGFDLI